MCCEVEGGCQCKERVVCKEGLRIAARNARRGTYTVSNINGRRIARVQVGNSADDSTVLHVREAADLDSVLVTSEDGTVPNLLSKRVYALISHAIWA